MNSHNILAQRLSTMSRSALIKLNLGSITSLSYRKLFSKQKVTDFLPLLMVVVFLIETKAIEMSPLAKVNPTNLILEQALEDSILKGMMQIYATAKA